MKPWLFSIALSVVVAGAAGAPGSVQAQARTQEQASGAQQRTGSGVQKTPGNLQARQALPGRDSPAVASPVAPATQRHDAVAGQSFWFGGVAGVFAAVADFAARLSSSSWSQIGAEALAALLLAALIYRGLRRALRRASSGAGSMRVRLAGNGTVVASLPMHRREPEVAAFAPSERTQPQRPVDSARHAAVVGAVPEGFDPKAFERVAKMIFLRLQASNDGGLVEELRRFTTPEFFAKLSGDMPALGGAPQQSTVVELDARVAATAREAERWRVCVRFSGLMRAHADVNPAPFVELWHLVKPLRGGGDWVIAAITPEH